MTTPREEQERVEGDPLAPTRGCLNGILMGIVGWAVIILSIVMAVRF